MPRAVRRSRIAFSSEEAKALALELGSPDRRTVMVDVAVELAESGRLKDAATAILSLPPEDGPGGAAFELLGQLHGDSRSQPPLPPSSAYRPRPAPNPQSR